MLVWLLVILGVFVLLAVLRSVLLKKGTLYLSHRFGFAAFSSSKKPVHQLNELELQEAVNVMIEEQAFDNLWINRAEDLYGGVILYIEGDHLEMSADFKTNQQQAEIAAFREAMKQRGLDWEEDSDGFNGGFGEEFRVTLLKFSLPKEASVALEAVRYALRQLYPESLEGYFAQAWSSSGVPNKSGLKYSPIEDPLAQIIGHH
ncbi:MAG TPA: hypothetical protein VGL56_16190 [Fimbriimonadaceae bacterium]|jgi:hypothetical protein